MNVLHIHTDPKFLSLIPAFQNSRFVNNFIFLSEHRIDLSQRYPEYKIDYQPLTKQGLRHTIEVANTMDLVIVYMLDFTKSYIINRINKNVKVLWRFFGAELYGRIGNLMFSEQTQSAIAYNKVALFRRLKYAARMMSLYGCRYRTEFDRAMTRANAVAMLYRPEYDYLSNYFSLPPFIQLPYQGLCCVNSYTCQARDAIILGNSRNRYNNHLDILEMLKGLPCGKYHFEVPFNYGEESSYTAKVRETAKQRTDLQFIDDFLPFDEYNNLFEHATAFVFNAYRQMAMGNIFIAIRNNLKIYLSPKNTTYQWLLSEGFIVFNIDNLAEDLKNNDVYLKQDDVEMNRKAIDLLSLKYNGEEFKKQVVEI